MSEGNLMTETKKAIASEQVMRIIGDPKKQDVKQLELTATAGDLLMKRRMAQHIRKIEDLEMF